jgi:hypothetical protein
MPAKPAKEFNVSQDQTLQQILADRVSLFAAGDRPREIIDMHVEKMYQEVIKDCFSSYGDFGKAVRDAVKAALPANVDGSFELARYNALITTALRDQWATSGVTADMVRHAQGVIDQVMKEDAVPAVVSLRELLQEFADAHKEEAGEGRWEAPRIEIETPNDGISSKWIYVYFDETPDDGHARHAGYSSRSTTRSNYQLKNSLMVKISGTNEKGHNFGRVCGATLDEKPIGMNFRLYSKWERLIGALYFGAADLVIDCDADDISYGIYD